MHQFDLLFSRFLYYMKRENAHDHSHSNSLDHHSIFGWRKWIRMHWKRQRDGEKTSILKIKQSKSHFIFIICIWFNWLHQSLATICFFFAMANLAFSMDHIFSLSTLCLDAHSHTWFWFQQFKCANTFFIWQIKVHHWCKIYEPCPICSLSTYANKTLQVWIESHFSKCHLSILLVSVFFSPLHTKSIFQYQPILYIYLNGILKTTWWCYIPIIWLTNWIHVLLENCWNWKEEVSWLCVLCCT